MNFTNSKLYGISNKKYLSELLYLDLKTLKNVDKNYPVSPFNQTKNNKTRELYNPSFLHKRALKRIVKMLGYIGFPEYLCGGIPKISYIDNASRHLNSNYMLLLDISNFFPSTNDSYLYSFFRHTMAQSVDIAKILVDLTTAPKGGHRYLPQGYSTSPMLSFLAYHQMYEELNDFSSKYNFNFSAYYDDFTFSSKSFIHPRKRREAIKIVKKYGFTANSKKTKLVINNHTRVTGVILNGNEMKAPKKLFKKTHCLYLRLLDMNENYFLYNQEDYITTCNKIQGCLASIQAIEPERNLENYHNTLKYIRNKFDVPVEKKKGKFHFRNILIKK